MKFLIVAVILVAVVMVTGCPHDFQRLSVIDVIAAMEDGDFSEPDSQAVVNAMEENHPWSMRHGDEVNVPTAWSSRGPVKFNVEPKSRIGFWSWQLFWKNLLHRS